MRSLARVCLTILVALGFVTTSAFCTTEDKEECAVSIFNGKDLTGWVYGKRGDGENKSGKGYQVESIVNCRCVQECRLFGLLTTSRLVPVDESVIYCTKEDGGNLYTGKEYGDFILRFEFKLEENANNGIGIRAPLEGDSAYVGMEIQVLDDYGPAYKDKLQSWQYHGSIYNVVPAKRGSLKPTGEWNSEEISAKGRQIKVTLNGTVIVDANLDDVKDPEVLKKHPGLARTKGHIGFLGHGARVEFRNLRIKEL